MTALGTIPAPARLRLPLCPACHYFPAEPGEDLCIACTPTSADVAAVEAALAAAEKAPPMPGRPDYPDYADPALGVHTVACLRRMLAINGCTCGGDR